ERACDERLGEAREILQEDVPVGEEAEQHELERLSFPDDRAPDLVEDPLRDLRDALEVAQIASTASTRARSRAGEIPFPNRSAGAPRSGRRSTHASSPSTARAASGSLSRSIPRRVSKSSPAASRTAGRRRTCRSSALATAS